MRFAFLIALGAFIADQVSKAMMLNVFRPPGVTETPFFALRMIEVLPFFNLRLAWNTGISFSLFSDSGPTGMYLLVAGQLCIIGVLMWWLRQAETVWMKAGVGLIVGGAFGNIVDRFNHGAVVDFLDFHAAGYHFPTFNLADTAISIGVGCWLLDAYLTRHQDGAAQDTK